MSRHGTGLLSASALDELPSIQLRESPTACGLRQKPDRHLPRAPLSYRAIASPIGSSGYDGRSHTSSTEVVNPLRGSHYEWRRLSNALNQPVGRFWLRALGWADLEPARDRYGFSSIDRALAKG